MKKQFTVAILILTFIAFTAMPVLAHSGRTDSFGGHWNHKTGTYHYHGGPRF